MLIAIGAQFAIIVCVTMVEKHWRRGESEFGSEGTARMVACAPRGSELKLPSLQKGSFPPKKLRQRKVAPKPKSSETEDYSVCEILFSAIHSCFASTPHRIPHPSMSMSMVDGAVSKTQAGE
jgi:hypothetical protein